MCIMETIITQLGEVNNVHRYFLTDYFSPYAMFKIGDLRGINSDLRCC